MGVHRIRLTAAWKPAAGEPLSWERVFHAPTGLRPQTRVRLCLRVSELLSAVTLNGTTLGIKAGKSGESTVAFEVENQRMCWRVEKLLAPLNRLVVTFANKMPQSVRSPPDLADDRRSRYATGILECSLEIDEDAT